MRAIQRMHLQKHPCEILQIKHLVPFKELTSIHNSPLPRGAKVDFHMLAMDGQLDSLFITSRELLQVFVALCLDIKLVILECAIVKTNQRFLPPRC